MVPPPAAMDRIITAAADTLMSDTIKGLTRGSVISSIEGQEHAAATLGISLNFDLVNSYAMENAKDYRDLLVKKGGSMIGGEFKPWLKDAIETDRKAVTDIVMKGLEKGTPPSQLRKDLDLVFTAQEHDSALTAYQETRHLLINGTCDRWTDEGITQGTFHHLPGQLNPRPEHEEMDGRVYDINDPYVRAELEKPNCHCSIEPLIPAAGAV